MKNLSIILITIITITSCSRDNNEIKIIKKFLNEIELNKEFDFLESKKFIEYNYLDSEKEKVISLLINENIKMLKKEINEHKPYEILTHKQALKKKLKLNFTYNNYSKVYHVIDNEENVITTFILSSKKIISFSYNIVKHRDKPKTPLLLNNL
jgi:hypothetical protein